MSTGPSLADLENIENEFSYIFNGELSKLSLLNKDEIFNIISTNNIDYIEDKLGISIIIDKNNKNVSMYDDFGILIGEVKPGNYGTNHEIEHLYKLVNSEFRNKGLGNLIYNIYKEHIGLPNMEVSSKISSIRFLLNHGYMLESKLIGTEFKKKGIQDDLEYINSIDYNIDTDDELGIIYRLVLKK